MEEEYIFWRRERNNYLLYNAKTRGIHYLTPYQFYVWRLYHKTNDLEKMIGILSKRLAIDKIKVRKNMKELLFEFQKKDLIKNSKLGRVIVKRQLKNKITKKYNFLKLRPLSPIHVELMLTNSCNLFCKHCIAASGEALPNELSFNEIKEFINSLVKNNVFILGLTGGEPLLRKELFKILKLCKNKIKVVLTTNGTLLSKDIVNKLKGLVWLVRVSLDSADPSVHDKFRGCEGSYNKTLMGIKLLVKNHFNVIILSTIYKKNLNEISKLVRLGEQLKVNAINFFPIVPEGRGKELESDILSPRQFRLFVRKIISLRKELKRRKTNLKIISQKIPFLLLKIQIYQILILEFVRQDFQAFLLIL